MICRLSGNILHEHAVNIFSSVTPSSKSWFFQIRDLCLCYHLPHPLEQLKFPLSKKSFKILINKNVLDYWEQVLRSEASGLDSLLFFKPNYMSLTKPHPIWTTSGCSPSKVAMATIQARMISGRYRTEQLCSHWSRNKTGSCLLSSTCSSTVEDLTHILSCCHALQPTRVKLMSFTLQYCEEFPTIKKLTLSLCTPSNPVFCQFLLDCSCIPSVIAAVQNQGSDLLNHLFHITRTWVYTLHKERMKLLGRWNYI